MAHDGFMHSTQHANAMVTGFGSEYTCPNHAKMADGGWIELGAEIVDPMCERYMLDMPTRDRKMAVSVYAVDRCYGGPEEGGWYYDVCVYTGYSERIDWNNEAAIEAAKARLLALFADEQPRYPISSVLSDGPEYRAWVESVAGESDNSREGKPRYS